MIELIYQLKSKFRFYLLVNKPDSLSLPNYWLRSTMDSISDSDSEDAGSIPAGVTKQQNLKTL